MSERIGGANGDRMRVSTRMRRVSPKETEGVSVENKRREEMGAGGLISLVLSFVS